MKIIDIKSICDAKHWNRQFSPPLSYAWLKMIKILHELKCVITKCENMTRTMGTHGTQKKTEHNRSSVHLDRLMKLSDEYFETTFDEIFKLFSDEKFPFSCFQHFLIQFSTENSAFNIGKLTWLTVYQTIQYKVQHTRKLPPSMRFTAISKHENCIQTRGNLA